MKIDKIAILGAGSWGTALAWLWAKHERRICLWGNSPDRVERVKRTRENSDYIPGLRLPDSVTVTHELRDCGEASLIVFVTPSTALREIATRLRDVAREGHSVLLSCTKGIEHGTGMRMSQILSEIFPRHELAVLSGPNLAAEVVRGLPTATVIGCRNLERAANLQDFLGSSRFRIYTSDDVTSIELGGALKNVFAIAAGASDGLGLGDNTKAAAAGSWANAEANHFINANGGGRNSNDQKRSRMRARTRHRDADHRSGRRVALQGKSASSGDARITRARSESGASLISQVICGKPH